MHSFKKLYFQVTWLQEQEATLQQLLTEQRAENDSLVEDLKSEKAESETYCRHLEAMLSALQNDHMQLQTNTDTVYRERDMARQEMESFKESSITLTQELKDKVMILEEGKKRTEEDLKRVTQERQEISVQLVEERCRTKLLGEDVQRRQEKAQVLEDDVQKMQEKVWELEEQVQDARWVEIYEIAYVCIMAKIQLLVRALFYSVLTVYLFSPPPFSVLHLIY